MFSPTTAQQFNTVKKYTESHSMSPTCFNLFRSSSGWHSTKKKNATVANYDFFFLYISLMMTEKRHNM